MNYDRKLLPARIAKVFISETKDDQAVFLASDPVADGHPEAHKEPIHLKSIRDTVVNVPTT
ncbi:hypothetical protein PGTUg99_026952 [Puccinia graminis f. sp. tritici]|uniref:Uncharacterized protein n=1 Tax=Puccinia graminis f. sp. tritici TaxID=56615 RepID=A0A5B0SAY6_PUCGR|nr:hypothetical protein PGTUg99_026952 [Puccinia graminis f. sp. tritici]